MVEIPSYVRTHENPRGNHEGHTAVQTLEDVVGYFEGDQIPSPYSASPSPLSIRRGETQMQDRDGKLPWTFGNVRWVTETLTQKRERGCEKRSNKQVTRTSSVGYKDSETKERKFYRKIMNRFPRILLISFI